MIRNLRGKKVIARLEDGTVREYASLREFAKKENISYPTACLWVRKISKPSIDIEVWYAEDEDK